jgi:hypothetical protein
MRKNYPERIKLSCHVCALAFTRPPSLVKKVKTSFCSKECADIGQTTSKRYEFSCEACGIKFKATKDHGADRRFCSRECFCANAPDFSEKECPTCGIIFKPIKSAHTEDGVSKHCSRECSAESQRDGEERPCLNCGKHFYTTPSHDNTCCSLECKGEYYRGSLAPNWKGGEFITQETGHKFVAFERSDRVSKYVAEHRMIVMRAIGRLLERYEYVIHINNIPDDNRPENLYVCGSNSQFCKMRQGSLPWPKKSNLKEYR